MRRDRRTWELRLLAAYLTVAGVIGVLAVREQEQARNDAEWDQFVCQLADDC